MHFWKWLYPGMRVKRWVALIIFGIFLLALGLGLAVNSPDWGPFFAGLAEPLRQLVAPGSYEGLAIGFLVLGIGAVTFGIRQVVLSITGVLCPYQAEDIVDVVYKTRQLNRGPKIVVIGGGTGLSTMLRGLKEYTTNITAIVTTTDDGGSSGRLSQELGVLPPGDIRNNLVALADTEPLMEKLFQYRFSQGNGLAGHSFGNLFLAAMTDITGDFQEAIKLSSRVLAVRGLVLPSTLNRVVLEAEFADGSKASGECSIVEQRKKISRVSLSPKNPKPTDLAVSAIDEADIIILGPGSLYTSILPNLLVKEIASAIAQASALKIYVCNIMTQPGETDGYTASDHVRAVFDHVGLPIVDYVIMNSEPVTVELAKRYAKEGSYAVEVDAAQIRSLGCIPVVHPLLDGQCLAHHAPDRLASIIMNILFATWGA
ncbi:MAG: YvcK family protein [Limnochordia bacterium]|nr:YvcK family protein [Limnochordia bacterium]